ncbi:hypothetical protein [Campylobacter vicugnae]|uniref:hypothetical protein n=1 Tax=Campylobacter vicugnae TaxID=1660076 RepID=UPI000A347534|nr:hypothetical protein [Campylobacter sp. RM8835]
MAIQKAFTQICQEILDRYDSILQTNSLSTQTKTEILAAKEAVQTLKAELDNTKASIESKCNQMVQDTQEFQKTAAQIAEFKTELSGHLNEILNKHKDITQKADEVGEIKKNVDNLDSQIPQVIQKIDAAKDYIATNEQQLKYIKNLTDEIKLQHIEVDDKFIELRVITRDTKNELETLNQQLIDTADSVKDEIETINQELIQTADGVKNDIYIEALRADVYNSTLKSQNIKAVELIDKLEKQELVDEMYLVKGEVVHTSAKLAAQSLGMTLATGAAMAMRVKYERELPSIAELKAEYENSNNIAKDRLAQLDLLLGDADKMVRNSEFYNLIGVFI